MSYSVVFERGHGPQRSQRRVRVAQGATLLEATCEEELPLARACGGRGLCGRCGLRVLAGAERLTPESPAEREAKRRNRIDPNLRLACCARVQGAVSVTADYW